MIEASHFLRHPGITDLGEKCTVRPGKADFMIPVVVVLITEIENCLGIDFIGIENLSKHFLV